MIDRNDIITSRIDKSQIVSYGTPGFSVLAEEFFYPPDTTAIIPEHWHEDLELLLVTDGQLFYSINGNDIVVNAGEGIFVNSRRIHSNNSPKGTYCTFFLCLIHPSVFETSSYIEQKYILPLLGAGSVDYLLINKEDWTGEIIDMLYEASKDVPATRDLRILENCYRFFRLLHTNCPPKENVLQSVGGYANTFKAMVTYISEHYGEKISLEDIANAGNVGKTLAAKIFKQFSSKTPGEYLIKYRINKSMDLLGNRNISITDIAYQTGFNSASHYTKTFRETVGCTPLHYRNGISQ